MQHILLYTGIAIHLENSEIQMARPKLAQMSKILLRRLEFL